MKTSLGLLGIGSCLALFAPMSWGSTSICSAITGNLVSNCGFESGDFTGWTLIGNDVPGESGSLYGVEQTDPYPTPDGTAPNSGSYQAFFADLESNATTLSQTITTVPGKEYSVSFDMAQLLVGPGTVNNTFTADFGSTILANYTDVSVHGYEAFSFSTDATSTSSALKFQLGNDAGEFLLDDVSVTAVPEPSTASLVLIGLSILGFGAVSRRRRAEL